MSNTVKEYFAKGPLLFASSAALVMLKEFGTEWLEWDPLTIEMEVRTLASDKTPHPSVSAKIMAACEILTSDRFSFDLALFNNVCNLFSDSITPSELIVPADLEDILWGVTEISLLLGDAYKDINYSGEIAVFVGELLAEEGIFVPPPELKFAIYPDDEDKKSVSLFQGNDLEYKAFWDRQDSAKSDLILGNRLRLAALFRQLQEAPYSDLDSNFAKSIAEKIEKTIKENV